MAIEICLAGATGWAGSALASGIAAAGDLRLLAAVSRTHAGRRLGDATGDTRLDCPVFASVAEALAAAPADVVVEYTAPDSARSNVLAALAAGAHVVVGTSGLVEEDLDAIDREARARGLGVLACGNFALTAVLLERFAEMAARVISHVEIVDYASDAKPDAPSGTARELAARLARARRPEATVPVEATVGERAARGATLDGLQVHSVRLPGFVIGVEAIFGMRDERLTIRHDAGSSARPYVDGALVAIRRVSTLVGLHRGLATVLDLE